MFYLYQKTPLSRNIREFEPQKVHSNLEGHQMWVYSKTIGSRLNRKAPNTSLTSDKWCW